jgi:Flp pilus assembly pilin Flp
MNSPQRRRIALPALIAVVLAVTVFLIPAWLPVDLRDQWEWIIIVLQGLITVGMVVYVVWFVRKQRDDYWLERGKDPKHPEL